MPNRRLLATALVLLTAAALGQTACQSTGSRLRPVVPNPFRHPVVTNPLYVPAADFETVWNRVVEVLDEYFEIASENRLSRRIVTQPAVSATLLEPWLGDTVGFRDRLESTLQTMHRYAVATVSDAPGGGFMVKVEVYKELEFLGKPERQQGGRAVFSNDFPVNRTREIVGPIPLPLGWVPRGRDPKLEQKILARLGSDLFL